MWPLACAAWVVSSNQWIPSVLSCIIFCLLFLPARYSPGDRQVCGRPCRLAGPLSVGGPPFRSNPVPRAAQFCVLERRLFIFPLFVVHLHCSAGCYCSFHQCFEMELQFILSFMYFCATSDHENTGGFLWSSSYGVFDLEIVTVKSSRDVCFF